MRYRVLLVGSASRALDRAPKVLREKIIRALNLLETDPFAGKSLKGDLSGCYSLRAWPFRIIYEIRQKGVNRFAAHY